MTKKEAFGPSNSFYEVHNLPQKKLKKLYVEIIPVSMHQVLKKCYMTIVVLDPLKRQKNMIFSFLDIILFRLTGEINYL